MRDRGKISEQSKKSEIGIIDEIFSEIEKDFEKDHTYVLNDKDKFCIAIKDIFTKEKIYRSPTLNRNALMKRMNMNKHTFIKSFQYCFGMPFRECINRFRLKESIVLLEHSDLLIEKISEKVGFGTVRTFQRQFMTMYNISPKNYRKMRQDKACTNSNI